MARAYAIVTLTATLTILSFYGADALKCYTGSDTARVVQDGCAICSKATGGVSGFSQSISYCSSTCTAGTSTVSGISTTTSCCQTDLCNGGASGLKCYSGDTVNGKTEKDGCAICSKSVGEVDGETQAAFFCEATCVPGATTYNGYSGTKYCCQTDLCNGTNNIRTKLVSALAFSAALALWLLRG